MGRQDVKGWRAAGTRPAPPATVAAGSGRYSRIWCSRAICARYWSSPRPASAPIGSHISSTATGFIPPLSTATRASRNAFRRSPISSREGFACWWRPMSPRADLISKTCPTSSISSSPVCRRITSIASVAPAGPGRAVRRSPWFVPKSTSGSMRSRRPSGSAFRGRSFRDSNPI